MSETVDDLTLDFEQDGKLVRKTLEKVVLTKGAWSTIAYLYEEIDRKSGEMGTPKVSIRRYKKASGQYREQSKFNLSGAKQARALVKVLEGWYPPDPA